MKHLKTLYQGYADLDQELTAIVWCTLRTFRDMRRPRQNLGLMRLDERLRQAATTHGKILGVKGKVQPCLVDSARNRHVLIELRNF
jgi:hypothetical protein